MNNNQTPPDKPEGGEPGGTTSASVSHVGATTISESKTEQFTGTAWSYYSETGGENSLLVTAGESTIDGAEIYKAGDESSENSDFYGTNAAVLVTGGVLNLNNANVQTYSAHANGVFAYGEGNIVVKNTTIKTTGNNSGGIMVAGGGSLTATDLNVETSGNSSAAIRSDRGGGAMTIDGGSYVTSGTGSPAIYSTANITASHAKLTSTASEGIVIEGSNSVSLYETTLTDTNTTLNGNSETYKNIFIYQSMSGDASEGTGSFSATNSTIMTNQGDTFFVTNTTANIELSGNKIVNNDVNSAFLRAQSGKWGNAGSNGGHVDLTLSGQIAEGDIVLDNVSSLNLILENSSFYMGAINVANSAQSITVSLDESSQLILAGDSYVSSLSNAVEDNMNIYSNGYKLYVGGSEVEINGSEAPEVPKTVEKEETETKEETVEPVAKTTEPTNYTPFIVGGVALLVIIGAIIAFVLHNKKKNGSTPSTGTVMGAPEASDGRPDFSAFDDGPVSQPGQPQQPQPPLTGQM